MTIATGSTGLRGAVLAALVAVAGIGGAAAWAQNATTPEQVVKVPDNVLGVGEIESRLTAQGIKVKEIEVHDLLAEIDGYDAQGREIEVVIDRRSGEMLSHKYDR